jgi:hypothetical protein
VRMPSKARQADLPNPERSMNVKVFENRIQRRSKLNAAPSVPLV